MSERLEPASLVTELGELCDAIGYRIGAESFRFANPIVQSLGAFKLRFTEGFKRGWKEAREGTEETLDTCSVPTETCNV